MLYPRTPFQYALPEELPVALQKSIIYSTKDEIRLHEREGFENTLAHFDQLLLDRSAHPGVPAAHTSSCEMRSLSQRLHIDPPLVRKSLAIDDMLKANVSDEVRAKRLAHFDKVLERHARPIADKPVVNEIASQLPTPFWLSAHSDGNQAQHHRQRDHELMQARISPIPQISLSNASSASLSQPLNNVETPRVDFKMAPVSRQTTVMRAKSVETDPLDSLAISASSGFAFFSNSISFSVCHD